MKNKFISILMLTALSFAPLAAQNEKDYLPKAGDLAIGIDMEPVYQFFGNIANGHTNNSLNTFGGTDWSNNGVSIMGKYMIDKNIALRVNLGTQTNIRHISTYQPDDKDRFLNPLSEKDVIDTENTNNSDLFIAAGIEFRRGKERIQGYLGADLLFGTEKNKYTFEYGNAITEINQTPSRNNYNSIGLGTPNVSYWTRTYATENLWNSVYAGLAARIGVEYFIVPKLSFGGEVSLSVIKEYDRGSYAKSEGFNPTSGRLEEHTELLDPQSSFLHIGTDDLGGKLFMMFYF